MSTIFMNEENSKTSDAHKLRHNLTDKIDLQKDDEHLHYQNVLPTTNRII